MPNSTHTSLKLSVSLHTLDLDQSPATIRLLGGSSVTTLELWEPGFDKRDDNVLAVCEALASTGVLARTVHAAFGPALDLSSPDEAIRAAGLRAVRAALDLAARTGAQIIVVHPSAEPIRDEERAARMQQSRRSIAEIALLAAQTGYRFAIELLPRTCLGHSAAELLALLDGLDPAVAGVCLDTNHLMGDYASLPDVARQLGPRLFTLHCSDYDGVDEKHWPPLRGVIDWRAFIAALQDAGYTGPLHYEANLPGETPAERLAFLEANFAQLISR
jgi:sugar phosphate isomerase/epimerase